MAGVRRFATIALVAFALTAAGCGFRPAGYLPPDDLAGLTVVDRTESGEIAWAVEQALVLRGIDLDDTPAAAGPTLRILGESFERRPLSVTAAARVAEYELIVRTTFALLGADGEVLIPPRTLSADAIYERDRAQLLGSREEERLLREELREDLVERLLRAVAVVTAREPDGSE